MILYHCYLDLTNNTIYDSHTSLPLNQIMSVSVELSPRGKALFNYLNEAMTISSFVGMASVLVFVKTFSSEIINLVAGAVAIISALVLWKSYEIAVEHPEKLECIRNINAMYYPLRQLYLRLLVRVLNGYLSRNQ